VTGGGDYDVTPRASRLSLIYVKRPLSSPPVNSKPILALRAVDPRLFSLENFSDDRKKRYWVL